MKKSRSNKPVRRKLLTDGQAKYSTTMHGEKRVRICVYMDIDTYRRMHVGAATLKRSVSNYLRWLIDGDTLKTHAAAA